MKKCVCIKSVSKDIDRMFFEKDAIYIFKKKGNGVIVKTEDLVTKKASKEKEFFSQEDFKIFFKKADSKYAYKIEGQRIIGNGFKDFCEVFFDKEKAFDSYKKSVGLLAVIEVKNDLLLEEISKEDSGWNYLQENEIKKIFK